MTWLPWAIAIACGVLVLAVGRADRPLLDAWATLQRFCVTVGVFVRRRGLSPERVRLAFEDLGPTYLKLAQLVASSQGLFPEAYCKEFGKTLDRVRAFPFEEVERIVAAELGGAPERFFQSIDRAPLASASIAQVHAARLLDGSEVVLKVQRPDIERRIHADVRILRVGAQLLSLLPRLELANPVGIVDDFARTLDEELDFQREAANLDEFNRIMVALGHSDVRAPRVEHPLTTRRLLTMERFRGVRVDDIEAVRARTRDPEERLLHGLHAWFQCLMHYGFFHGDVHAGNLMLLDDASLGFLDFGIIGRFEEKTRHQITDYIVAFATGDYRALARTMQAMGSVAVGIDLDAMARDLERAYAPMLKLSFGDLNYAELLPSILRVSYKHQMRLPREFVLVTKQMLYFDRYAKLLAPRLNVFSDPRLVARIGADVMKLRQASNLA